VNATQNFRPIVTIFSQESKFLYMPKLTVVNLLLKFASGQFDGSACEDQCEWMGRAVFCGNNTYIEMRRELRTSDSVVQPQTSKSKIAKVSCERTWVGIIG
jgi:hypothetical protein